MILQVNLTVTETIFIVVIVFGLALVLNYLTYNNLGCFFGWLLVISSIFVGTGLLELWTLILILIANFVLFGVRKTSKKVM